MLVPKNKNRITSIYELIDPRDNQTRYIGKTVKKLQTRLSEHIYHANYFNSFYVHKWINKLSNLGLKPIINEIDEFKWKDSAYWEIFYIALYKSWDFKLTNTTNGGEGILIKKTKKWLNNMANSITKYRNICQYDYETGEFIKSWNTLREIETKLNIFSSQILNICKYKPKCKSAGGYLWRFYKVNNLFKVEDEKDIKYNYKSKDHANKIRKVWEKDGYVNNSRILNYRKIEIYKINLKGIILENINAYNAILKYGDSIRLCLFNRIKTYKNFIWVDKKFYDSLNEKEKNDFIFYKANKISKSNKLTEDDIKYIYLSKTKNVDLSKKFNITPTQVGYIKNKQQFKNITRNL